MARLIYSALASLDGYIADRDGTFDWAAPDDEVHRFLNDLQRQVGTMLLGRRTYDVLVAWETMETAGQPDAIRDFADLWRATDKVVYSRTLERAASARTRIERDFDPASVQRAKANADRDLSIGGPDLAGHAIRAAGLVDEIELFVSPISVGGGTRAFPDDVEVRLELLDERRFGSGVVYLRYRIG
jgi:dihydrofolate reductase